MKKPRKLRPYLVLYKTIAVFKISFRTFIDLDTENALFLQSGATRGFVRGRRAQSNNYNFSCQLFVMSCFFYQRYGIAVGRKYGAVTKVKKLLANVTLED
jgi:hypothetical protein